MLQDADIICCISPALIQDIFETGLKDISVANRDAARKEADETKSDKPVAYSPKASIVDKSDGLMYNNNRGESNEITDEFRKLQSESRAMLENGPSLFNTGNKEADGALLGRLSGIFRERLQPEISSFNDDSRVLSFSNKGNNFNIISDINAAAFHDIFEISRAYLRYGELVDLHPNDIMNL